MRSGFPYNPLIGNEVLDAHKRLSKILAQSGALAALDSNSALSKIGKQPTSARRLQLDVASSLNVAVLANAQWQTNIAKLAVGSELGEALQRITELASVRLALPAGDGFSRLAELIDAGEIDEHVLWEAEESIEIDVELSAAIELAADALAQSRPLISRDRARQIIVFWVWLMYGAGLWALAVFGGPALVAVPAALGAPAAPQAARKVGDKRVPRLDEEQADDE